MTSEETVGRLADRLLHELRVGRRHRINAEDVRTAVARVHPVPGGAEILVHGVMRVLLDRVARGV